MLIPLPINIRISFATLVSVINAANELVKVSSERNLEFTHIKVERIYKMIATNDKDSFIQLLNNSIKETTDFAISSPYENHESLLLIKALSTILETCAIYSNLSDIFEDFQIFYVVSYSPSTYHRSNGMDSLKPEATQFYKPTDASDDFDFDDPVESNDFNDESNVVRKDLGDDFDDFIFEEIDSDEEIPNLKIEAVKTRDELKIMGKANNAVSSKKTLEMHRKKLE